MRNGFAGVLVGAALAAALGHWTLFDRAQAQGRGHELPDANSGLLVYSEVLFSERGGDRQQLVVVDPRQQTMATYLVEQDGIIQLKCVRKIRWDLQLEHFNAADPLPEVIRSEFDNQQAGP